MSVFLKIKDTFNKALKKGVECDSVYLTDEDYVEFCSDFNKENISEITINTIKLSISKVKDKENSFLTTKMHSVHSFLFFTTRCHFTTVFYLIIY